jgi:hypothetical protein
MVEDFLELNSGFAALMRGQIRFSAHINGIEGPEEPMYAARRAARLSPECGIYDFLAGAAALTL